MLGIRHETGGARQSRVVRGLPTVLMMFGVALAGSCTKQTDDVPAAMDEAREGTRVEGSDFIDPEVFRADVHPLLRVDSDGTNNVEVPRSYPHTVQLPDGASVVYDQGPTPGGYPWVVLFFHADGAVEIQELDDHGVVQARTYGSTSVDE